MPCYFAGISPPVTAGNVDIPPSQVVLQFTEKAQRVSPSGDMFFLINHQSFPRPADDFRWCVVKILPPRAELAAKVITGIQSGASCGSCCKFDGIQQVGNWCINQNG